MYLNLIASNKLTLLKDIATLYPRGRPIVASGSCSFSLIFSVVCFFFIFHCIFTIDSINSSNFTIFLKMVLN